MRDFPTVGKISGDEIEKNGRRKREEVEHTGLF